MNLISYRKNVYSQNGEDGVIEEILNRLNIQTGKFLEFGGLDGVTFSNTYNLLKNKHWEGFYIEKDKEAFLKLEKVKDRFTDKLTIVNTTVDIHGENSLDNLIKKHTNFLKDFEVLSIDIDSYDYQVWENLKNYSPLIVLIEIESTIHPPKEQIHSEAKSRSSFSSIIKLGKTKGYTALCHTGNIIFIRDDKLKEINLEQKFIENPDKLFLYNGWFFSNADGTRPISWTEEYGEMKIFEFNPETNLDFYKKENFKNQLEICKFFDNFKNNKKFNLHFYWQTHGKAFDEKHALSIKSAIATQNLNNCQIILWSNKDLSDNPYVKSLLPYISHKIWDMEKYLKKFDLEKLRDVLKEDRGWATGDIFRILCLGEYGGIYSDLDVVFLKDLSPLLDYEFTYFWPSINSQNGAIMRINYKSNFFKKMIEAIKKTEKINPNWLDLDHILYSKVRESFKDYSIFPTSWFDGDWLNIPFEDNFKSNKEKKFYDGAFAWHWHNNWNKKIEKDSKFDIYRNQIDNLLSKKTNLNKKIIFKYKGNGNEKSVCLVGSFNNWNQTKHILQKNENNIWEIEINLQTGFYQYKFIINGNEKTEWVLDQDNKKIIGDGIGNFNSLIEIENNKTYTDIKIEDKSINILTNNFLDRKIYCFWMNNKSEMNEKRKDNLKNIAEKSQIPVELVTLKNLDKFILKDYPIHEGFKYLSAIHKSDYLRSYFMNFYGGGYCDIKPIHDNWVDYFNLLDSKKDSYGAGYPPFITCQGLPDHNFRKYFSKNKNNIIGCSAFIFKKQTPITIDWYLSINSKMDAIFEELKKYPAEYNRDENAGNGTLAVLHETNQKYFRDNYFYPVYWEELHGNIFYPLTFKYSKHILRIMQAPVSGGNCLNYGCHLEKDI